MKNCTFSKANLFSLIILILLISAIFLSCSETNINIAEASSYSKSNEIILADGLSGYNPDSNDCYYKYTVAIPSGQDLNVIDSNNHLYAFGNSTLKITWRRHSHKTGTTLNVNRNGKRYDMIVVVFINLYRKNTSTNQWVSVSEQRTSVWEYDNSEKVYEGDKHDGWYWNEWNVTTGQYKISVRAESNRGNSKRQYIDAVDVAEFYILDESAPKINSIIDSTNGQNLDIYSGKYYSKSKTVFIDASDALSGIKEVSFELNGNPFGREDANSERAFSKKKTFDGEGEYSITFTDYANNKNTIILVIDTTPPKITAKTSINKELSPNDYTNLNTSISADGTGSPVKKITYTINNQGTSSEYKTPLSNDGKYVITATDAAGNSNTFSFTIDKTKPIINVQTINGNPLSGTYTNQSVTVTVSDNTLLKTTKCNGTPFTGIKNLSTAGVYTITAEDIAGNEAETFTFTIDKTEPIINVQTIDGTTLLDGDYTNQSVTVTASDAVAFQNWTYSINGGQSSDPFTGRKPLSNAGVYTVTATDKAGNSSTFTFTIDTSVPKINSTPNIKNYSIVNSNVTISVSDSVSDSVSNNISLASATYRINNSSETKFTGSKTFDATGVYTITATDKARNSSTFTFTIDKTLPTITAVSNGNSISSGSFVSNNVTITASDNMNFSLSYRLGSGVTEINFTSGKVFEDEGQYTITATDEAGNKNTFSFTIDKTAPIITLKANNNTLAPNTKTRFNVYAIITETNFSSCTYSLNGKPKGNYTTSSGTGSTLTQDGTYIITITDKAGLKSSATFYIDKTAPTLSIKAGNTVINENGTYTNQTITITTNDSCATGVDSASVAGGAKIYIKTPLGETKEYDNSLTIQTTAVNGMYTIWVADVLGNSTISNQRTIYLDTNAPIITASDINGNDINFNNSNVAFVNAPFTIVAIEQSSNYYSGHPNTYLHYSIPNQDIIHDIEVYNGSVFAPIYINGDLIRGGTALKPTTIVYRSTQQLRWSWADQEDGYALSSIKIISPEGKISSYNSLDNVTYYKLEETSELRTFYNVEAVYNNITAYYQIYIDTRDYVRAETVTFDFINNTLSEGSYTFYTTDGVGNMSAKYTIIVDTQPPIGRLIGVENNGYTNSNVSFTWDEESASATLNSQAYKRNSKINAEGTHTIILSDAAGNIAQYTFTIDKTAPTGTLIGATHNGATNGDVRFTWTEDGATATLNGNAYISGTLISEEGKHSLILSDEVGNSTTYLFTIDRTPYTANYEAFLKMGTNANTHWWETYTYFLNSNTHQQVEHIRYSFDNYNDAYTFSYVREQELATREAGIYQGQNISCAWADIQNLTYYPQGQVIPMGSPYWIYYSIQSKSTLYAYFDQAALNEAIIHWAQLGVTEYYVTDTSNAPAQAWSGDEVIPSQQTTRNIIFIKQSSVTFRYKNPEGITLDINNGTSSSYNFVLQAGNSYFIKETDEAGNITEYTLYIDIERPVVYCTDAAGNWLPKYNQDFETFDTVYTSNVWTISIADYFDAQSVIKVVNGSNTTYCIGNDTYTFFDSGEYTVTVSDVLRNLKKFTVYVSLSTPAIIAQEDSTPQGMVLGVFFNIDLILPFNSISNILITCDGISLLRDDNNQSISSSTLQYYFATSGEYEIVIQDNFGREVTYSYLFDKAAPRGILATANNVSLPNGAFTTKVVKFTWVDESCSGFISTNGGDNLDYISGTNISDEGTYQITLRALDGKESYYTFTIDRTAPVGKLEGVTNNGYTNTAVKFSWAAAEHATVQISFTPYGTTEQGAFMTIAAPDNMINISPMLDHKTDGNYILKLIDAAENSTVYRFTVDTITPTIICTPANNNQRSLIPVYYNGSVFLRYDTNQTISFTWTDTATATLQTLGVVEPQSYNRRTNISEDGTYTLSLTDQAGNVATLTVKIDKSIPEGILNGVINEGITNTDVSFTWTEEGATAILNGNSYDKNVIISDEGEYRIVLTNRLGTSITYTFTIDKTAPTGVFSNESVLIDNYYTFNKSVYFYWTESSAAATLYKVSTEISEPYIKRTYIDEEGLYTLTLQDIAGNNTVYYINIDLTPPTGTLIGVENGGYTNGNVSFTWDEVGATATLNKKAYNGSEIYLEGDYTIILRDPVGNARTYTFTIDKTAPIGTFSATENLFLDEVYYFNSNIYLRWSDRNATAVLSGATGEIEYTSSQYIQDDGKYTITLTDIAGNSTVYNIIIDKTAPEFEVLENKINVEQKSYYNGIISFTWDEAEDYSLTINNIDWAKNQEVTEEGYYSAVFTDLAGNKTRFNFTIDKVAPTGTFSSDFTENNGILYFSAQTSFTWTDSRATATLNDEPYSKRQLIQNDGQYILILLDSAGNTTTYNFVITTSTPTITFNQASISYNNVLYFKSLPTITWNNESYKVTVNGEEVKEGYLFPNEGGYYIDVRNLANTSITYNIIVDLTPPEAALDGVTNNGITSSNVSISWYEDGATATLNDEPYKMNAIISASGNYIFILKDRAGNTSNYFFSIDKSIPEGTLFGVNDGGYTNTDVYFSWNTSFEDWFATLDGGTYLPNSVISNEGEHIIEIYNQLGVSVSYIFTIDKTAPVAIFTGLNELFFSNSSVMFTWNEEDVTATCNKRTYKKMSNIYDEGDYELILTDLAGNSTTYNFTIDRTPPIATLIGVAPGGITSTAVVITFGEDTLRCLLDDETWDGEEVFSEGNHTFTIYDSAGNSNSYSFTIDKSVPVGILIGVQNFGSTNTNVSFTWDNSNYTATLNNTNYKKGVSITANGTYTIILTNKENGLTSTYMFTIDKTIPVGTLFGVENGGTTGSDVIFTFDEENATSYLDGEYDSEIASGTVISSDGSHTIELINNLGTITIYTFTIDKTAPIGTLIGVENGGATNKNVSFTWTEFGCTCILDTLAYSKNYTISAEGTHTIYLSDKYGNISTYTFTIDKTAPVGMLSGVDENGYTNTDVSFSWAEESATATLNGDVYEQNTSISEEGIYTITITDSVGNARNYTFTIDKTAPTGTFSTTNYILSADCTYIFNSNLSFGWTEANITASILKGDDELDNYKKNTLLTKNGMYIIELEDQAGNITRYKFEIKLPISELELEIIDTDGNIITSSIKVNGAYTASSSVQITPLDDYTVAVNGNVITDSVIIEQGSNNIELTDRAGNVIKFTIVINNAERTSSLSTVDIILIVIGVLAAIAIAIFIIRNKTNKKAVFKRSK